MPGDRTLDWDKLRVFQAAADAGSFTHAGEALGLSQSAVSRQVSALEHELQVPLFHRHARGLLLTEQGDLLARTVKDVVQKLETTRIRLNDSRSKPNGDLKVTTTLGIGTNWLTPRIGEFLELYPDIRLHLIFTDDELDLGMREADVAIRMRAPTQPDLIQRKLFTMHFHAFASQEYLKTHNQPRTLADLDEHRIVSFNTMDATFLNNINYLIYAGRDPKHPRSSAMTVNSITAIRHAIEKGIGIAVLPDYIVPPESPLVRLMLQGEMPELDCYLVYPEEMKNVARVQVFRDFMVSKAQRWLF